MTDNYLLQWVFPARDYVIAQIHPEASFTPNSSQVSGVLSIVSQNVQTSGLRRSYNPPTGKQAEPLNGI